MHPLDTVVLNRARALSIPPSPDPVEDDGFVDHLEVDLLNRGALLGADARSHFLGLNRAERVARADWLLASLDAETGVDRNTEPLFRNFPGQTPADFDGLLARRILAFIAQEPEQPCVSCGLDQMVSPVSPCGHLVCRFCFDPADYAACPICNRRVDSDDPFVTARSSTADETAVRGLPVRLTRISAVDSLGGAAEGIRDELIARRSPLSPTDVADLRILITGTTNPGDTTWVPDEIISRQTKAVVFAHLVQNAPPEEFAAVSERACAAADTATDLARLLWTLSGNDPSLDDATAVRLPDYFDLPGFRSARSGNIVSWKASRPRVGTIRRPLRRAVLNRIDQLGLHRTAEDMGRHSTVWKRLGERLHPFEHPTRRPSATVAFAAARASWHAESSGIGQMIVLAAQNGDVRIRRRVRGGERVKAIPITLASQLESALAGYDIASAITLLQDRPGDLIRNVNRLATMTPVDQIEALAEAVTKAAAGAAPNVSIAARAALNGRETQQQRLAVERQVAGQVASESSWSQQLRARLDPGRPNDEWANRPEAHRVFFPRGGTGRTFSAPDHRKPLPADVPGRLQRALEAGLVERAGTLSRFNVAVIDEALVDMPVPSRSQAGSGGIQQLPRGALFSIGAPPIARLFLHWTQPAATRVDLDLSVSFLDDSFRAVEQCSYSRLVIDGARHSGDFTSAPAPEGATEYIDIDIGRMVDRGIRYVAPAVFAYTPVAFGDMDDAFAGLMLPTDGTRFDPNRVIAKFDLFGDATTSTPLVMDLVAGTVRWLDLYSAEGAVGLNMERKSTKLARLIEDLETMYRRETRASMFDLAALHAFGRCDRVFLHRRSGAVTEVTTRDLETLRQLTTGPDGVDATLPEGVSALVVFAGEIAQSVGRFDSTDSVVVSMTPNDPRATSGPDALLTDL